jgi:site-specific DNA-cytosine methylase
VKRSRFINTYLKNHRKLVAKAPLDVSALNDAVTAALHQGPPADTSAPIDISTLDKAVKSALPTKRGFGYGLAKADGQTRTLSARYYKDGAEILYKQPGWQRPRRLTPTECGRLMGFDEKYVQNQVVSDSRAYMQYGNAVVPPVVAAIGHEIVSVLTAVRSVRDAA